MVSNDGYVLRPAISSLSIGHQSAVGQAQDDLVISRFHKRPQTIGGPSGFPGHGAPLSAARSVNGVKEVVVKVVWDPPWDMDRMDEAAKLQLGLI